jgi:RimJ/RimL family protein N-acetyltransferase
MGRPFELQTERLVVRMLERCDVTEFVRYRNLPEVARYQDWPLPYTRDLAHQLVDELEQLNGPTPGGWVQLAVERADTGRLAGDIAVWLDEPGTFAMLGYTLAPEQQGLGFATEAVAAVVDHLFAGGQGRPPVHRVGATLDPANLASARVLEACGFEYIGTARSSALVRGEWTDDARYSLLRPDWEAWKARPTAPPRNVELSELTHADLRSALEIVPAYSQRGLVAPVATSLAEALVPPIVGGRPLTAWYRGIRADGELVGFAMVAEPHSGEPHPYLWRLVIDRPHQLRGIGRQAVLAIAAHWRGAGATTLKVSFVPDVPGNPRRFYEQLGFVPTGKVDDGEVEAALDLTVLAG